MFGDTNQCDPVELRQVHYDYNTSIPVSEMCPKRVEMKYIERYACYDPQTKDLLTKFLNKGIVEHQFEPRQLRVRHKRMLEKQTRRAVTEECCDRYTQNKDYCYVAFKYRSQFLVSQFLAAIYIPRIFCPLLAQHQFCRTFCQ